MRAQVIVASAFLCAVLAATGFVAASFAQSGGAGERAVTTNRTSQPPTRLWGRFPLGKSTVGAASTAVRTGRAGQAAADSGGSDSTDELRLIGLTALALLLAAVAAFGFLRTRQRRLVAQSRQGLLAIMAEDRPREQKLARIQAFTTEVGCDKVSFNRPRARGKQVTDDVKVQSAEPERAAAPSGYAELGDRVAAVLQAAEEAAAQIRADASAEAEQLTRQAQQESKSLLEESKSEAQRVRVQADTEAKNTREAVETYATKHRREAEEKAAKMLSDAEVQARASREAAEAMAKQIEERAQTLGEEVREQERMVRGRMQRYLAALRDVAGQIEEVIGETERAEPTLVEALDPEKAKQQSG